MEGRIDGRYWYCGGRDGLDLGQMGVSCEEGKEVEEIVGEGLPWMD